MQQQSAEFDIAARTPEAFFAARMKQQREQTGLSQVELASMLAESNGGCALSLDGTAITRIEKGTRRVRLDEAVAIALVLGLDLVEMVAPDPGSAQDRLERAEAAVNDAAYAANYWERERAESQRRLEELRAWLGDEIEKAATIAEHTRRVFGNLYSGEDRGEDDG